MLDSVASGQNLPEKNIILLGGTPELQREFLESLSTDEIKSEEGSQNTKKPPMANHLALGYTYHDVLDADHEDTLARLSIFLLSDPSPSFTSLLKPLLTPKTIPITLVVILLDWTQPWFWLAQLKAWIRLLRSLLFSLDNECQEKMKETMIFWRDRGRGNKILDGTSTSNSMEDGLKLPLGSGEWDEALGVPLCVVCQNSDRIDFLEKEHSWKEDDFDFVLQFLRTILLKHGASLIYTTPSLESPLKSLLHSSLGIHSLLKPQSLRHNVIDRDKVLVPPNWDSWGKIRVLRDGFDVEAVSKGWSLDITKEEVSLEEVIPEDGPSSHEVKITSKLKGAVEYYERVIQDPSLDSIRVKSEDSNSYKLEVVCQETQEFLATQLDIIENAKLESETPGMDSSIHIRSRQLPLTAIDNEDRHEDETHVKEHIGPVRFNMGGIQVDADDILSRLKDRQNQNTLESTTSNEPPISSQSEALTTFFEGLMLRGVGPPGIPKTKSA